MGRWLLFPPVLSVVLLCVAVMFGSREAAFHVPAMVWGMIVASYVCMCAVSMFHIMKRDMSIMPALSFLSQGLILSTVSLHLGAYGLGWFGLLLFLVGLGLAFVYGTRAHVSLDIAAAQAAETEAEESSDQILSKIGLPACFADQNGTIEEATVAFFEAVAKKPEDIVGEQVGAILSPDDEGELDLPSGTWWIKNFSAGTRRYIVLMPTKDGKPLSDADMVKPIVQQGAAGLAASLIDPATGLYTEEYREMRAQEEVARSQKYKRPLSSILTELTFDDQELSPEHVKMIKTAFAQKVKEVLRDTDCGFWMDGRDQILILLPETQQAGAKTLASRLQLLPNDVFDEEVRDAVHAKVTVGMFFCNGATPSMDLGVVLTSLEHSFESAKDGSVGNAA